ncbi:MAG TPA: hypothetical protein PK765_03745 [bacterium]|nr:hypothetical protein [bacterium]
MKRLVFLLLAMFVPIAFSMSVASASECSYDEGGSVLGSLENCIPQGSIDSGGDASISSVKDRIIAIADNAIIL